jgi:hypothetical protein
MRVKYLSGQERSVLRLRREMGWDAFILQPGRLGIVVVLADGRGKREDTPSVSVRVRDSLFSN